MNKGFTENVTLPYVKRRNSKWFFQARRDNSKNITFFFSFRMSLRHEWRRLPSTCVTRANMSNRDHSLLGRAHWIVVKGKNETRVWHTPMHISIYTCTLPYMNAHSCTTSIYSYTHISIYLKNYNVCCIVTLTHT